MKRKILLIALVVLFSLSCMMILISCKNNNDVNGTYYYGVDGNIVQNNYYILKDKTWTDNGGSSGEYEVNGTSITLYIDMLGMKTEYMSGTLSDGVLALEATRGNVQYYYKDGKITDSKPNVDPKPDNKITVTYDANGGAFGDLKTTTQTVDANSLLVAPDSPTRQNYTFSGWSKSKLSANLWDFANDKTTENTTLYAVWKEESARIFSVDGATINNYEIYLLVDKDTDIVSLSNKVICSDDSIWKLYYDRLGQVEIPTKIAASASGSLVNGSNVFYVVVTSKDGTQTNLYTLNVYRSYSVNVVYYANDKVIYTDTAYTGYEYQIINTPTIEGYTFNYWKDSAGNRVMAVTPMSSTSITADVTANEYKCTLDVNSGNALDKTEYTFTYDQQFTLPRATRTGYTFLGWYVGDTQITDNNGQCVTVWNYSRDMSTKAKWQANKYTVTATSNDETLGTVTGGGEYDYDSRVTITATAKTGCNFVGWYDSKDNLVSENKTYTYTMGFDASYTAKFDYYTLTVLVGEGGALNKTYSNEKVSAGAKLTLTATPYRAYEFAGWFDDSDNLISENEMYEFTMGKENAELKVKFAVDDAMSNFNFTSAATYCYISSIKDWTIAEIVVPEYVTDISYGAFKLCGKLESITLPFVGGSVKTSSDTYQYPFGYIFGAGSYTGGVATKQYYYGSSTSSETYTSYCIPASLKSVTITGGNILYGAFYNCSSLTRVIIGNSVTSISGFAFYNCRSLTSVTIGDSVASISGYAFYNCSNLRAIYWNATAAKYTKYSAALYSEPIFKDCNNITTVVIGDNVTTIPRFAVSSHSPTSLTIGSGVTLIETNAFVECDNLTSITFKGTVAQWNNIQLGNYVWGSDAIVVCSDGEVSI